MCVYVCVCMCVCVCVCVGVCVCVCVCVYVCVCVFTLLSCSILTKFSSLSISLFSLYSFLLPLSLPPDTDISAEQTVSIYDTALFCQFLPIVLSDSMEDSPQKLMGIMREALGVSGGWGVCVWMGVGVGMCMGVFLCVCV